MNSNDPADDSKASRRSRIAYWVIAAIAAYFLLVEHRAHVFALLPLVLLLLCPLMHVFHRGHRGHGHDDKRKKSESGERTSTESARDPHHHRR